MNKLIGFIFLVAVFPVQGIAQNLYTLKNRNIELSLDKKGNLVSLTNLRTGHNYATGRALWRLYFDRENPKDNEVLGSENLPSIRQDGNQIILAYTNMQKAGEELNFQLSLKIVLEGDMLRFCSEISNNELHTVIRELQYPLLGNCNLPLNHQLLTTQRGGHIYTNPVQQILSKPFSYMGPDHKFRQFDVKYPIDVASNCFALIGKKFGLYFASHDTTFQDTSHGFRVYPDGQGKFVEFEVGIYKFPSCLYDQSWGNSSNIIAPYLGDWHQTSKIYRDWANTWWEHREEPRWVKEMIGFQRIIMRHQYGETLFTYDDFADKVKKAGKSVGINVAFPFGWWDSGMDNGYPDSYYLTDQAQGGDKAWKKAVADYQKDGGKVLMYFNGKLIDTESGYYRNGAGKELCFKTNAGTEHNEAYRFSGSGVFTGFYNARSFVVADTKDTRWQDQLVKMADRAIELGANSVFYDQLGYAEKSPNWDTGKEFPVPDLTVIAAKANALKKIHDYIDKIDPELAIGTEHITDVTSQQVDYVHGIYHIGNWTAKGHTNFVDWFRYTFPEIILTDRNVDGDEEDIEWLTNRALLLGLRTNVQTFRLRGLISETPRYQAYLAKVNQLKNKYQSLLLLGTYRDTEGFSVDNSSILKARAYVNRDRMAIVMAHQSNQKATTRLTVPGYSYKEYSGVGDLKVDIGTDGKPSITIGKDGLVVLIYEK